MTRFYFNGGVFDKLMANKENVFSSLETKMEQLVRVYSQVGGCDLVYIKGQAK